MDPETLWLLIQAAPTPILTVRADGTISLVNRAASELAEYDGPDLIGKPLEILLPERFRSMHGKYQSEFMKDLRGRPMGKGRDLLLRTASGKEVPVEIGLSPVETPDGMLVICTLVDLTPRAEASEELLRAARVLEERNRELADMVATDPLTGLRSRRAFLDHLLLQLETSIRTGRPLSLLILDVDLFKAYNDEFGHLAGDEILRMLGVTLQKATRRSDLVARIGGEEFGALLPDTDSAGARVIGERFRNAVEGVSWPLRQITVSVGATTVSFQSALPRPEAPRASQLLTQADRALYRSKDRGRNQVSHFDDLLQDTEGRKNSL